MAVGQQPFPTMHPVSGFKLGTTCAGIKTPDHRDLVVMEIADGSAVAALFTQNAFCAAPVSLCKDHLSSGSPRYLVVNTGNANAGTGIQGMADAEQTCSALATLAGVDVRAVLPFPPG